MTGQHQPVRAPEVGAGDDVVTHPFDRQPVAPRQFVGHPVGQRRLVVAD